MSASPWHHGHIYLDLADKAWRAVDIRCDGWQLTWYCSLAQRSLICIGFIIKIKAETI